MSHAPSTFGTITTSRRSPTSVTNVTRSSSTHGDSREFTSVHKGVPPRAVSRAARTRPAAPHPPHPRLLAIGRDRVLEVAQHDVRGGRHRAEPGHELLVGGVE